MSSDKEVLKSLRLNEERYIAILRDLIGETEFLQNSPTQNLVPQEQRVVDHLLRHLHDHLKENGGVLEYETVAYVDGRPNFILRYPSTAEESKGDETLSFIGSHMDVVPANPEDWDFNPFELSVDGDELQGRGTTDCLGHVALITDLFCSLAELKPQLSRTIVAVFIANEENSSTLGIGVDKLDQEGRLQEIKNGPVFWIDAADSEPCIGTAGVVQWQIKCDGVLFHSGLPHKAVNPIELVFEGLKIVQDRFYEDYPPCEQEAVYNFLTPSSLKPTQIECSVGSLNQIPSHCTVSGDIRLTPFYDMEQAKRSVEGYVQYLNDNLEAIPTRGNVSKYELPDGRKGVFTLVWVSEGENGIACDLSSPGHQALVEATREVKGEVTPFSISGSLPLVREMQESGYDLQICGYGKSSKYHAQNESCSLSDMKNAAQILSNVIYQLS
jgi:acetylornithine deacetylase